MTFKGNRACNCLWQKIPDQGGWGGNETKPKINMLTHLTLGTKLRLLVEIDDKEGKRQLNNEKKYSYI